MTARDDYPPASITSQWAEMCDAIDSLREQLARQAPVIEAAEVWLAAYDNELYAPKIDDRLADAMNEYLTVRALSVPAPPHRQRPMLHPDRRRAPSMADVVASATASLAAAPPTEEGAP